jgi:hypothetical protein
MWGVGFGVAREWRWGLVLLGRGDREFWEGLPSLGPDHFILMNREDWQLGLY